MTVIHEEFSAKPRAETIADFTMAGGLGGGLGGGGRGGGGSVFDFRGEIMADALDRAKVSGSESPQESPRVRVFTFTTPVRPK